MNKNLYVPSNGRKYSDIELTTADIAREDYKKYLGGGADKWDERGAFQLLFLQQMGLQPHHHLIDVGCGPGRAAKFFINFLDAGHYTGTDYNAGFIAAAEAMVDKAALREKRPRFDVTKDFSSLGNYRDFDFCMVFSVLNHCTAEQRRSFFSRIGKVMKPNGRIFITHTRWFERTMLDGTTLVQGRQFSDEDLDIVSHGWLPDESISPVIELWQAARVNQAGARSILLSKMPRNGICAEIGVWKGEFSERILSEASPRKLHLIDPWLFQGEFPERMYGGSVAKSQIDMDAIFGAVRSKFAHDDRVVIDKQKSIQALNNYPDRYFDWVYIDGNHYYDFVLNDLELCFSKVRNGGYICGDDYTWGKEYDFPVRRAVTAFAERHQIREVEVIGSQYIVPVHNFS